VFTSELQTVQTVCYFGPEVICLTRTRNPELTRITLLDAAAAVLRDLGAALSLDAVAKEAGVSKGGLLHHFPSREALLNALALRLLEQFRGRVAAALDAETTVHGQQPGAWARAYIAVSFDPSAEEDAIYAVMQTLALQPDVLAAWKATEAEMIAAAEADGLPLGRAHAIRLACDGLCLSHMSAADLPAVREELTRWTR
jgi:AcrR family transcriptional regulator